MFRPNALGLHWTVLISGDAIAGLLASWAGLAVAGRLPMRADFAVTAIFLAVLWVAAVYFQDLYTLTRPRPRGEIALKVLRATVIVAVAAALAEFALPYSLTFGRRFYGGYLISGCALMLAWRLLVKNLLLGRVSIGVMVTGSGEESKRVAAELARHAHLGYRLLGFVEMNGAAARLDGAPNGVPHLGDGAHRNGVSGGVPVFKVSGISEVILVPGLDSLVIADPASPRLPLGELLSARVRGVSVLDGESFCERLSGRIDPAALSAGWPAAAPGFMWPRWRRRLKRAVDLLGSALIAAAALPVALLAALLIKLDSRGPVLYMQERVGAGGTAFSVYKFRSMVAGAEDDTGAVWARARDPRVTRVGRLIRRLRIDELPQLFNVLRGEMSLVGPRPERPELAGELKRALPLYDCRHFVSPGLTGWAQICWPYGASVEDAHSKLCYDLYYIKNWSLGFDLQIMMQTAKVVLFGRGAR